MPLGYFPLGDTISSVNPIFGQGMTVAFGHAKALGQAFTSAQARTIQEHYIRDASSWSLKAWRRSSAYDSMFDKDNIRQQAHLSVLRSLALKKQQQAHENPDLFRQLIEQGQMLG